MENDNIAAKFSGYKKIRVDLSAFIDPSFEVLNAKKIIEFLSLCFDGR